MEREASKMEADVEFLNQRLTIMKEIQLEREKKLQEEKLILDELQNNVFKEKLQFCERVHEFTEQYGLLAVVKHNEEDHWLQRNRKLSEGMSSNLNQEIKDLEKEIASSEAELSVVDADLNLSKMNLGKVQEEYQRLIQNNPEGNELKWLQELKQRTEVLELQCQTMQQELNWQQEVFQSQKRSVEYGNIREENATADSGPVEDPQSSSHGSNLNKCTRKLFVPKAQSKMSHDLEKKLSQLLSGAKKF